MDNAMDKTTHTDNLVIDSLNDLHDIDSCFIVKLLYNDFYKPTYDDDRKSYTRFLNDFPILMNRKAMCLFYEAINWFVKSFDKVMSPEDFDATARAFIGYVLYATNTLIHQENADGMSDAICFLDLLAFKTEWCTFIGTINTALIASNVDPNRHSFIDDFCILRDAAHLLFAAPINIVIRPNLTQIRDAANRLLSMATLSPLYYSESTLKDKYSRSVAMLTN